MIFVTADDDQPFEARRCVGRDLLIEARRRQADARTGMFENIAKLAAMQLGARRHCCEPAMPEFENGLENLHAILRDDGDTIAGFEVERMQRVRKPPRALGESAVGLHDARAIANSPKAGMTQACARKPRRDVHTLTSS